MTIGDGISTLYAHGSEILVEVGDEVTQGTPVLKVGSTGVSTGPHAHVEVRINGSFCNPKDFFGDEIIMDSDIEDEDYDDYYEDDEDYDDEDYDEEYEEDEDYEDDDYYEEDEDDDYYEEDEDEDYDYENEEDDEDEETDDIDEEENNDKEVDRYGPIIYA